MIVMSAGKRWIMSKLRWTKEKPEKPGWYWWRFDRVYGPRIVCVEDDTYKLVVYGIKEYCEWVKFVHGEWAGPIEEPRSEL